MFLGAKHNLVPLGFQQVKTKPGEYSRPSEKKARMDWWGRGESRTRRKGHDFKSMVRCLMITQPSLSLLASLLASVEKGRGRVSSIST